MGLSVLVAVSSIFMSNQAQTELDEPVSIRIAQITQQLTPFFDQLKAEKSNEAFSQLIALAADRNPELKTALTAAAVYYLRQQVDNS